MVSLWLQHAVSMLCQLRRAWLSLGTWGFIRVHGSVFQLHWRPKKEDMLCDLNLGVRAGRTQHAETVRACACAMRPPFSLGPPWRAVHPLAAAGAGGQARVQAVQQGAAHGGGPAG